MIAALAIFIDLAIAVLIVWALIVIVRIPAILERQASLQAQTQQALREVLIEIRNVTRDG